MHGSTISRAPTKYHMEGQQKLAAIANRKCSDKFCRKSYQLSCGSQVLPIFGIAAWILVKLKSKSSYLQQRSPALGVDIFYSFIARKWITRGKQLGRSDLTI